VCSCDFPFFPKKAVFFVNAGSKKKSPASAADFPQRKPIAKTKANIAAISAADLNFRVTTLLAGKPAARPLPEWIGERTLLTVGDRLRLRLSPRLLTGDGLPVPCCRFAPPTAL